jgi:hypothetical protein
MPSSFVAPVFLLVHGVSNYTEYQIDSQEIKFQETLMFQKRVYSFPLHNTGTVALQFKAFIHLPLTASEQNQISQRGHIRNRYVDGDDILSGQESVETSNSVPPPGALDVDALAPFHVSPQEGVVAPGQATDITVIYTPFDAVEFVRELWFLFTRRLPALPPPRVLIKGNAVRPVCHFELEGNDYVEARRADDLNVRYPLPTNTRVFEIKSRGVGNRNTRSFHVLNPTNMAWDYSIIAVEQCMMSASFESGESSSALYPLGKPPFTCLTSQGTVVCKCLFFFCEWFFLRCLV